MSGSCGGKKQGNYIGREKKGRGRSPKEQKRREVTDCIITKGGGEEGRGKDEKKEGENKNLVGEKRPAPSGGGRGPGCGGEKEEYGFCQSKQN